MSLGQTQYELIVIGGGPAGLAAAHSAWQSGLRKILIIERDKELGGILNQCIHNGFGLHYFKEELTGPEYAERFVKMVERTGIEVMLDTMALEITQGREVHIVGKNTGYRILSAGSIVLAMGCRERTRGAIGIPGSRPAGIFTAGTAQRYVNIEGYMVGKRAVILGSGDIGLIMARRLTLEGAKVLACVELMPYSGGLTRNIVQCLHDYDIPLYLSHTVTEIRGKKRVEQVVVSKVDENRRPIPGSEMVFDCDTIILSVGLIPENELARAAGIELDSRTGGAVVRENMETSVPGIFACGNALHVHDLVDFVTTEGEKAGASAAEFAARGARPNNGDMMRLVSGDGVSYTVPQHICVDDMGESAIVFFRVNRIWGESRVVASAGGKQLTAYKREHMAPGEIERITLPKKLLDGVCSEITIYCEEAAK
ncbi:MAG: NAD(P)/FAD-dependent oxidoreductase [Oscillospiraceae bacterium]|nr:NAD(P)/FAD-dependent oxidoreductase [Oscillospiraceae bacterium]